MTVIIRPVTSILRASLGENTALVVEKAAAAAASAAAAQAAQAAAEALVNLNAPMTGHPLQSRYKPGVGTPAEVYGMVAVSVYGTLPSGVLIAERTGPSAIAFAQDGMQLFRDLKHIGRWVDFDRTNGLCLVGGRDSRDPSTPATTTDYRTVRWLDPADGSLVAEWTVPGTYTGEIYGLRVVDDTLLVNMLTGAADGATYLWQLDLAGQPTAAAPTVLPFAGTNKIARGLTIDGDLLWVASMNSPTNPQGCQGALQAYSLTSGLLVHETYGHYPNDVDVMPDGRIAFVDEHLDRIRIYNPTTEVVESAFAGSQLRAEYEPAVSSFSANDLAHIPADGSDISAVAVEYRGIRGLYAPNGARAITNDLFVIADTDNGRVIVARRGSTAWEFEVAAVIAHLNEPTKVVLI